MENNFILKEVIGDLVNGEKSLVGALLKLQYFAALTENETLADFVSNELNGYSQGVDLPEYRKAVNSIRADVQFGDSTYPNLEIPFELIDEQYRDVLRVHPIIQSVSVLENKVAINRTGDKPSQLLVMEFPMIYWELVQGAAEKLYKSEFYRAQVVGARLLTNADIVPKALTAIRSRLLTFVIETSKSFGYNVEIESFNKTQETNNEKLTNLFMSTVINNQGDGNLINTGTSSKIDAKINVSKGNVAQLADALKRLGIDSDDIDEIHEIVKEEADSFKTKSLGDKTIDWITKVSGKALKGVGSIAKGATSSVLADLVKKYFDIPL
ncbi:hypothetical protein ACR79H_07865 [Sphingobacterium spiritivorum]|uniref:AbiTii domain-containing protein n=1 Tax=Sphingobacterium spiritivorum TaxID=258 RepID=UPI003DA5D59B